MEHQILKQDKKNPSLSSVFSQNKHRYGKPIPFTNNRARERIVQREGIPFEHYSDIHVVMGRKLALEVSHSIQPAISLILLAAWVAVVLAVVAALCGFRSKKSSTPKSSAQDWPSPSISSSTPAKASEETEKTTAAAAAVAAAAEAETPTPLPLPPALQRQAEMQGQEQSASPRRRKESGFSAPLGDYHFHGGSSPKSSHGLRRGVAASLSMRLPEIKFPDTLMRMKTGREILRHRQQHSDDKKHGEFLWTKTILRGERCRVPDGEDNDNIIYDDMGNRIPTFPPKTPRSLPASRTNSCIDPNSLPTDKS